MMSSVSVRKDSDYSVMSNSSSGILIHKTLATCIHSDVLPGSGVTPEGFWGLLQMVIRKFSRENEELLAIRDQLQAKIDNWYRSGRPGDQIEFLRSIGYLVKSPACSDICISTTHLDPAISQIAAPQLVVPVDNDRFVVNAVNSRWGSLGNAVASSDVIGHKPSSHDIKEFLCNFLDESVPLLAKGAKWSHVQSIGASSLGGANGAVLKIALSDGSTTGLKNHNLWVGWSDNTVYFKHHGLHISLKTNSVGAIEDLVLESAATAILDLEDSVASVDAEDKSRAYRNWARVMAGDMKVKTGEGEVRSLRPDISYRTPSGSVTTLPGRVVSLVRNVGIHCKTNIVLTEDGNEVYEGLVDAVVTIVAGLKDLRSSHRNSRSGSIYLVKPKLHGPREVEFACRVLAFIEHSLSIPLNTVKIGIMDEERRTSVNLRACIATASQRVFFINTGFLDRTGDEIHTCMHGGIVAPKGAIKSLPWIAAYEKLNVIAGVASGFLGKAQIGKGMWAEPDSMKRMMVEKVNHPLSAASTAWVPSPTAATLHAIHYHRVNVKAVQRAAMTDIASVAKLERDLLTPPLIDIAASPLSASVIQSELENNAQGILGYVVRWVDLGIGSSKVPDLSNVGLMEDLATLRISSQHICNWLLHGVVTEKQIDATFRNMAKTVDSQNAKDPRYRPMSMDLDNNVAFQTALRLVKDGTKLANGYSIGPLVEARRRVKARHVAAKL
jgi:malate synthase